MDYLLGISNESPTYKANFSTEEEQELIQQYRKLDSYGKELIKLVVKQELLRCTSAPYQQLHDSTPTEQQAQ